MIGSGKEKALEERLARLGIRDADLEESFVVGSGPGGQKINKTANCVHLLHRASGIEIQCQDDRRRSMNRYLARVRLCERFEADRLECRRERDRLRARARFKNRKRSRAQKARLRDQKKRRTEKKRFRKRVSGNGDT